MVTTTTRAREDARRNGPKERRVWLSVGSSAVCLSRTLSSPALQMGEGIGRPFFLVLLHSDQSKAKQTRTTQLEPTKIGVKVGLFFTLSPRLMMVE
jgi:hypothetical protein